ncbi:MAG: glycosyl hydrolase 53 family protein [Lachnospiraceae bacterium]|nr:glycosyl hydrolase 53 family protein [Lachnospiraceae bacterium]
MVINIMKIKWFLVFSLIAMMTILASCGKAENEESNVPAEQPAGQPAAQPIAQPAGPYDSEIHVKKVEGLHEDFITGADISSFISQIESGVAYYDWDGNPLDEQGFFDLLAYAGLNYVRLRVWNDPYDQNGRGYGGGNNDVEKTIRMGQWATNAGMKVLVNFHYSDFWADPGKQFAPKNWENLAIDDKAAALFDFTEDTLRKLLNAGVDVGMVQVGNETNHGFSGERAWGNMAKLYHSGCDAARKVANEFEKDILIAVHFTDPNRTDGFIEYAKAMDRYKIDYDVFAASYYPFWHGDLENLSFVLLEIAQMFDKKVLVTETSYAYTFADGDGHSNSIGDETPGIKYFYPVSVQGQADAIRDIVNTVALVGEAGLGVIYWEPAWIPVGIYNGEAEVLSTNLEKWEEFGSGWASSFAADYDPLDAGIWYGGSSWDNQAMFDFAGKPLASLNIWKYVRHGAVAPLKIEMVKEAEVKVNPGEEPILPASVSVLYNDSSTSDVNVVWDETQVGQAVLQGMGIYYIDGTIEVEGVNFNAICRLDISPINYVPNPSFEENDISMWTISNPAVAGIRHEPNNARSGEYCLHFWSEDIVEFSAEQTIGGLASGYYTYSTNLQGGDAGSAAEFFIYAIVDGERFEEPSFVTGWQEWQTPEISGLYVAEDGGSITIGVSVRCAARGWGSFDDFLLYK